MRRRRYNHQKTPGLGGAREGVDRPLGRDQLCGITAKIPPSIIGLSARTLENAYMHSDLDSLFLQSGFPGDLP